MYLNPPTTWSSKFWYLILVGSFIVSQQVFWYPNATMTITRWANHLYSASVNFGSQVSYIIIDNLMNEGLSFRIILIKVTFVTSSVASLMLDSTWFVLGLPCGTCILTHVLVKCHLEAFVALPWSSEIFYRNRILQFAKPDSPIVTDLLRSFFEASLSMDSLLSWDGCTWLLSFNWLNSTRDPYVSVEVAWVAHRVLTPSRVSFNRFPHFTSSCFFSFRRWSRPS
jgi:hypothetical protein